MREGHRVPRLLAKDQSSPLQPRGDAPPYLPFLRTTIAQLLVFPARNPEVAGRNMLRRKLMRTVFHSMFDVGRSMFDVRLAAANGCSK
jgi:hypothetical protein